MSACRSCGDEWLMLMRDLHPSTPIGISRHYVAIKRRQS